MPAAKSSTVTAPPATAGAGEADPAVREAAEVVTIALSLVAPYVAEEMWELLGHQPSVANAAWPAVDPRPAGDRCCDLRRPGAGQGSGPPAGPAHHRRGGAALAGPGRGRRGRAQAGRDVARSSSALPSWSASSPVDLRRLPPRPSGLQSRWSVASMWTVEIDVAVS